jgi:hypothetical protein
MKERIQYTNFRTDKGGNMTDESKRLIYEGWHEIHKPQQSDRTDDEPESAKGKMRAGFEAQHPTEAKTEYLTHQPQGSGKEKMQKGWEEVHPKGLTAAEGNTGIEDVDVEIREMAKKYHTDPVRLKDFLSIGESDSQQPDSTQGSGGE